MGRDFKPSDQVPGAAPVAILNYGFWQRRYGKDPAIIGRAMRMNGAATTSSESCPKGFPFRRKPTSGFHWLRPRRSRTARIPTPGSLSAAWPRASRSKAPARKWNPSVKRLESEYPVTDQRLHLVVQNFPQFFIGADASLIYGSMWGAVGFVLLIACANLANLMLARAMAGPARFPSASHSARDAGGSSGSS